MWRRRLLGGLVHAASSNARVRAWRPASLLWSGVRSCAPAQLKGARGSRILCARGRLSSGRHELVSGLGAEGARGPESRSAGASTDSRSRSPGAAGAAEEAAQHRDVEDASRRRATSQRGQVLNESRHVRRQDWQWQHAHVTAAHL